MLQQSRSKGVFQLKYLAILPILCLILTSNACIEDNSVIEPIEILQPLSKTSDSDYGIPFIAVDKSPVFDTCKGIADKNEQKKCFSEEIKKHINDNSKMDEISSALRITSSRVYVRFKIDKTGKIVDIKARGPHPNYEKEAIRLINSLPKITPGKHQGKEVAVLYSLPIIFNNPD